MKKKVKVIEEKKKAPVSNIYTIEYIEQKCNVKLDQWQREFVEADEPRLILRCGRKTGKTHAMAFKIVYILLNQTDEFVCILSMGQKLSDEVYDAVLRMLYILDVQFAERPTKSNAVLANKNRLISMPTGWTGASLRPYSFSRLFVDEAAFLSEDVFVAATPTLAVKGKQLCLASTPQGSEGAFYNAWHDTTYRKWFIKTEDCPRVTKAYLAHERTTMTKFMFQQEYEALFTEQAEGLIPKSLITACMHESNYADAKLQGNSFLGVVYPRIGDENLFICVCNVLNNRIRIVEIVNYKVKDFTTSIAAKIAEVQGLYPNTRKIIVSERRAGTAATDTLIELLGQKKIMVVDKFPRSEERTPQGRHKYFTKEDIIMNLVKLMENNQIEIIMDREIEFSLRSLRYSYDEDGRLDISGKNIDVAHSIALSVFPILVNKVAKLWVSGLTEKALFNPYDN